jgi:hypothetical protein
MIYASIRSRADAIAPELFQTEFFVESFNTAAGVNQLLLARVERMAL